MAEAFVNVTEGAGKKLHAYDRTIGANTVLDESIVRGEYPLASYIVGGSQVLAATAADHLLQIMAGASLNVRVRRILVRQHAAPASVSAFEHQVLRLTTAGTGGTAVTPAKMDTADAAAGAAGMTLPTAKGTESTILLRRSVWAGTAAIPTFGFWEWTEAPGAKPIIIPAGVTNGIAIKTVTGTATLSWSIEVEIVETSFL